MYKVAGDNVFGQWFSKEQVLRTFQTLSYKDENENFDLDQAKIVHINWSYNLYQIDNKFYLSGFWRGKENQTIPLTLFDNTELLQNIIVVGNDYNLIVVNTETCAILVISRETEEAKKINLNIERPVTDSNKYTNDSIVKVVATNNSCIYLTAEGAVYSGLLPSWLDTSHCQGKVCDVQCGYEHHILLTDLGRVYTWGNGRRLQLGHGDLTNIETPTEVNALAGIKIVKIIAGGWHSLALSEYGDLYVWGWNDTGQLGVEESNISEKEDLINGLPKLLDFCDEKGYNLNVKDIAAGSRHSAVLLEDNSVWTTGCNKYGQLGFSPDTQHKMEYFKKAYQCDSTYNLICGLWCTVLVKC